MLDLEKENTFNQEDPDLVVKYCQFLLVSLFHVIDLRLVLSLASFGVCGEIIIIWKQTYRHRRAGRSESIRMLLEGLV